MNDIKKYAKLGITKIRDVNILEKDDMQSVSKLTKELQRVFEVHQLWRTETEMRYSVLNDVSFPTPASKYWQCVREQNVFWENLVQLSCDYQKTQGELELKEIEYDEIKGASKKSQAQRKIKDAEIKQKQFGLMNMRLQGHDRVREIKLWEKIKNELTDKADFDINDVNKHQVESYAERWEKEMNIGAQTNQADLYRHSKANLETMQKEEKNGN
jgi:vancomycin resistance protein YoaR